MPSLPLETSSTNGANPPKQSGIDHLPPRRREDNGFDVDKVSSLLSGEKKPSRPPSSAPTAERPQAAAEAEADRLKPREPDAETRQRPALELDDEEAGEPQKSSKREGRTLDDYAKEKEISPREIYSLMVDLGIEGEAPVSIGALKDRFRESRNFEQERDDFEDWRSTSQNEIVNARNQMQDIMARLSRIVPSDVMAKAFSDMHLDMETHQKRQRGLLLEYFPQWRDVQQMNRDREELVEMIGSYGFSAADLDNVQDARIVKF